MGMFDSFYLQGRWAEACKCPNGHPMTYEMQTKDLQCVLARVHCHDDGSVSVSQALESTIDYEALDGDVEVGGECLKCKPVYLSTMSPGHYNHAHYCVSVRLRFRQGRLVEVAITETQTTDDMKRIFKERGSKVEFFDELPEDAKWPLPWTGECQH